MRVSGEPGCAPAEKRKCFPSGENCRAKHICVIESHPSEQGKYRSLAKMLTVGHHETTRRPQPEPRLADVEIRQEQAGSTRASQNQ